MRHRLGALVLGITMVIGAPSAAWASRDGDRYDQREGCGEQGGGCNNDRHENYEGAGCKYICPTFDKSPVQDSFNFAPQVCLPGATCYFEDRTKKGEGSQPEPKARANSGIACLVPFPYHCDPKPS